MSQPMQAGTVALHFSGVPKDFDDAQLIDYIRSKFDKDFQISSVNVCKDWNTRKSRGSAYVNASSENALKIIHVLNHTKCDDGSELNITFKFHDHPPADANLFINNLNVDTSYQDFEKIFGSDQGVEIQSCKLRGFPNKKTGYVQYKSIDEAKKILALDGSDISGNAVKISKFISSAQRAAQQAQEFRSVYIKNFEKMTNDELEKVFIKYGPIESSYIFEKIKEHDGVSTYAGLITFKNHDDAVKAIQDFNGQQIPSQNTSVEVVRFKNKKQRKFESKNKVHKPELNLWLSNIPDTTSPEELRKFMEQFGEVDSARIMTDSDGKSKNYGYCSFMNLDSCQKAKGSNGAVFNGAPIFIKPYIPKAQRQERRRKLNNKIAMSLAHKGGRVNKYSNANQHNKRQDNTKKVVTPVPVATKQQIKIEPIPKAEFEAMDDADKHETFGEKIYEFVQSTFPTENPGKITGMILESFKTNYNQLNSFIANGKIIEKINEAIDVLKKHNN